MTFEDRSSQSVWNAAIASKSLSPSAMEDTPHEITTSYVPYSDTYWH